jgi:hypothetical protein
MTNEELNEFLNSTGTRQPGDGYEAVSIRLQTAMLFMLNEIAKRLPELVEE